MAASTSGFAKRLSIALVAGDKKFLTSYRNALDGKTGRQQRQLNIMRYVMRSLIEDGQDRLSDKALWDIFVDRLKLYSSAGAQKNLRKHYADIRNTATTSKR
jgi:hypothetical protein